MRRTVHITAEVRSQGSGAGTFTVVTIGYKHSDFDMYFRGSGHQKRATGFAELCRRPHAGGVEALRAIAAAAKSHRCDTSYALLQCCAALAGADANGVGS